MGAAAGTRPEAAAPLPDSDPAPRDGVPAPLRPLAAPSLLPGPIPSRRRAVARVAVYLVPDLHLYGVSGSDVAGKHVSVHAARRGAVIMRVKRWPAKARVAYSAGPRLIEALASGELPPPPGPVAAACPEPTTFAAVLLLALTGCTNNTFTRLGFPNPVTEQGKITLSLWQGSWIAGLLVGAVVWGLILMWMLARVSEAPFASIFEYLSFWDRHFRPFMTGHVETESLVYYATVTVLGLFGTTQVLAWRRRR